MEEVRHLAVQDKCLTSVADSDIALGQVDLSPLEKKGRQG